MTLLRTALASAVRWQISYWDAGVVYEVGLSDNADVALGIALGLALTLLVARALSSLLFGVAPADPRTLGGVSLAIALVGVLTRYLPARRASKEDPVLSTRGG